MAETKTFDTSTLKGLRQAERYQQRLYNKYDKVTVLPIGFDRVRITGSNPAKPKEITDVPANN